jgi:hypothetical protein
VDESRDTETVFEDLQDMSRYPEEMAMLTPFTGAHGHQNSIDLDGQAGWGAQSSHDRRPDTSLYLMWGDDQEVGARDVHQGRPIYLGETDGTATNMGQRLLRALHLTSRSRVYDFTSPRTGLTCLWTNRVLPVTIDPCQQPFPSARGQGMLASRSPFVKGDTIWVDA